MPSMSTVLGVIMGGGKGTRLHPLTKQRSKPAVPIAGKYRLIDIPISNCINSGIFRVAILTQFNSVSLHRHISQAYNFDVFHTGWVQIWAAEQTPQSADWYQGTADAVRGGMKVERPNELRPPEPPKQPFGEVLRTSKPPAHGAAPKTPAKPLVAQHTPPKSTAPAKPPVRVMEMFEVPAVPPAVAVAAVAASV